MPKPKHDTAKLLAAHARQHKRATYTWDDGGTKHWSTNSQQDLSNASLLSDSAQLAQHAQDALAAGPGDDSLAFGEMGLTAAEERLWAGLRAPADEREPIGPLRVVYAHTRRYVGLGLVLAQVRFLGGATAAQLLPTAAAPAAQLLPMLSHPVGVLQASESVYYLKPSAGDAFWTTDARLEVLPGLEPISERCAPFAPPGRSKLAQQLTQNTWAGELMWGPGGTHCS